MDKTVARERKIALCAIAAAAAGLLFIYLRENARGGGTVMGMMFNIAYAAVLYIYVPLMFSLLLYGVIGYAADLINSATELSALSVALYALALFLAGFLIFARQEGAVLIVTIVFLAFRLLWRRL